MQSLASGAHTGGGYGIDAMGISMQRGDPDMDRSEFTTGYNS